MHVYQSVWTRPVILVTKFENDVATTFVHCLDGLPEVWFRKVGVLSTSVNHINFLPSPFPYFVL